MSISGLLLAYGVIALHGCGGSEPPVEQLGVSQAALKIEGQTEHFASNPTANARFGSALSVSGANAIVGAAEHAYAFRRSGSQWLEEVILSPSDSTGADDFGRSVAISGDTAIVGAPDHQHGNHTGAAYVFVRTNAGWIQQAELFSGSGFGQVVAIHGDTAAVSGTYAGQAAVHIYERAGTTWTLDETLSGGACRAASLALSSDWLAVGDPTVSSPGQPNRGAVCLHQRLATGWWAATTLNGAVHTGHYGATLALNGDTLLVGEKWSGGGPYGAWGRGLVYERNGVYWSYVAELRPVATHHFASTNTVALSNGYALIGSYNGKTYVFEESGGWANAPEVLEPAAGANAVVAADQGDIFIGLPGRTGPPPGAAPFAGAVYSYYIKRPIGESCLQDASCFSSHCVDGVCCVSDCGGGATTDCEACSIAAGASADGTCETLPDDTYCDDGDLCSKKDICSEGSCGGQTQVQCASTQCTAGQCDPLTGSCSSVNVPNGISCNSSNPCSFADQCIDGVCTDGKPVQCTATIPCHYAVCDPVAGCIDVQMADGSECTGGKCISGICQT